MLHVYTFSAVVVVGTAAVVWLGAAVANAGFYMPYLPTHTVLLVAAVGCAICCCCGVVVVVL